MPIFSDHCSIDLFLKVKVQSSTNQTEYEFLSKPDKIRWDRSKEES